MDSADRTRMFLMLSIVVTVVLFYVPYVGYPLMLLSTLAHEMGHGIAAIFVGGEFVQFEIFSDGSGVARHRGVSGRFGRAFVSAGGLCGPAVVAAAAFALGRKERHARIGLGVAGALLVVSLVLVVRNLFGWVFVGGTAAACLLIAIKAKPWVSQVAFVFVAVQLALSVFSRGDYLFMEYARTASGKMPSDVSQMSSALFLPYWFWGGLCGAFSIVVLFFGLKVFFSATRDSPEPTTHTP